jgi:predicted transcriptional regulator
VALLQSEGGREAFYVNAISRQDLLQLNIGKKEFENIKILMTVQSYLALPQIKMIVE